MDQDLLRIAAPFAVLAVAVPIVWTLWKKASPSIFLNKERKRIRILEVTELSHDTKRFRLDLGGARTSLGLPVGKHIVIYGPNPTGAISGEWNGKPDPEKSAEIQRKYTPTTGNETLGYVDLVVKIYHPGTVKMPDGKEMKWADGGKGSLYLDGKKPGDYIDIMGPVGVNEYLGQGNFKIPGRTVKVKHVGMMAGGTGLTPMLQVVTASLLDPSDTTCFSMIYANKTESDILCRDLLDEAAARSNGRFTITYTLDFPPADWKQKTGFITQDMIKECLPPPSDDAIVLMCGPPPMVEFACKKNLEALGYAKNSLVAF